MYENLIYWLFGFIFKINNWNYMYLIICVLNNYCKIIDVWIKNLVLVSYLGRGNLSYYDLY